MRKHSMDYFILITTLVLVAFGLIMVFSATYYSASIKQDDGFYYLKRQLIGAMLGLGLMIAASFFPYQKLQKLRIPLIIIAFILLVAVLVPGAHRINLNGSSRWLNLGMFSLQPSEVAKLALIIFISSTLAVNQKRVGYFLNGILGPAIVPLIFCGLLLLQPNFSAIVCIGILTVVMILVGGANGKMLALLCGGGVAIGFGVMMSSSYRANRVNSFMNPWDYSDTSGYQVMQSLYAIGSGGFFGRGLGNSRQKLLYLPYGESDFIFPIVCEELGFIGALVLILLFAFLIYRIIRVAINARDMFGCLVATGVATIICIQVIINIAVVTSSIPPTGVSMPFISYGSSALVIFMLMIGIVLNISKFTKISNEKERTA